VSEFIRINIPPPAWNSNAGLFQNMIDKTAAEFGIGAYGKWKIQATAKDSAAGVVGLDDFGLHGISVNYSLEKSLHGSNFG